jgi:hypothetical protein
MGSLRVGARHTQVDAEAPAGPVVTSMTPNVVDPTGGVTVRLAGSGLGTSAVAVSAVCVNSIGMLFGPVACTVLQDDVQLSCMMPSGVGTDLRWFVSVNGTTGERSGPLSASFRAPALGSIVSVSTHASASARLQ